MRLTKRAYAFLCRQYRLILQQNHLANAVCRGLVAGAVGVTLASGVAHAAGTPDGVISVPESGAVYTVEEANGGNYLTTFATKAADGTEVTYGVTVNNDKTIAGAASGALGTGYTVEYNETTKTFTVYDGGTIISSSTAPKDANKKYTGQQIGQTKTNTYYNTVYVQGSGSFLHSALSNYTEDTIIEADFVNNTVRNTATGSARSAGGALYNGLMKDDDSKSTASITSITGDFIGNTSECTGGSGSYAGYGYGGAIANLGYSTWKANIGPIDGDFIGNTASGAGGAIYSNGSSGTATIGNITGDFIGNTAAHGEGGAIVADDTTVGTITGNFIGNTASSRGGAIEFRDITKSGAIIGDFVGNTSVASTGGAIHNAGTISAEESGGVYGDAIKGDFVANKAKYDGGAIHNRGIINGNIVGDFYDNTSSEGSGGAIYNYATINGDITGDFHTNVAAVSGGAIYNDTGENIGNITGDFSSNVAQKGDGGAIYNNGDKMGSIEGDFAFNSAGSAGGAIFTGPLKDAYGVRITIDHITGDFTNNTAVTSGGAVHSSAIITNFTGDFTNNSVANDKVIPSNFIPSDAFGGALHSAGTIENLSANFTNNSVTNNSTSSKTGSNATINSYALGGALYNTGDIGTLKGKDGNKGSFSENTVVNSSTNTGTYDVDIFAYAEGGALYSEGKIDDINEDFKDNSATNSSVNTVGNRCNLTTTAKGGAIYSNKELGDITGNFEGNKAENKSQNTASYRNYSFPKLTATAAGGAIYTTGTVGTITGNFSDNHAINTSTWNGLSSETVEALGGAIYNTGTIAKIDGDFSGNSATLAQGANVDLYYTNAHGGAIYNDGTITAIEGDFTSNTADENGGAISSEYGKSIGSVIGDFTENTAGVRGGAVYNEGTMTSITGAFSENTAKTGDGGAVYNYGIINGIIGDFSKNEAGASGGAICNDGYDAAMSNVHGDFTENSAGASGGAIYNKKTINGIIGDFSNNEAGEDGGAIFTEGTITGLVGDFADNKVGGDGGAIYNEGTLTGIKGSFTNNIAGGKGGAIYTTKSLDFTADAGDDFEFTDNMAGSDYNAIYVYGSWSSTNPTTLSFTMNDTGKFAVNDSILGKEDFAISIDGVGVSASTFTLNGAISAEEIGSKYFASTLNVQDVMLDIGTYAHTNATTAGSLYVDNFNINGNTDIDMEVAENTIEVINTKIADATTVNIDAGAIAANSTGNVKTGTLTMGTGSTLNLTGDTFIAVSSNTTITSATVNVGDTTALTDDDATKLSLADTKVTGSTITVTGTNSALLGNGQIDLDDSTLTFSENATANVTGGYWDTLDITNNSKLEVKTASKVALNGIEATDSTVTVNGEGSSLTTQRAVELDTSTFTLDGKATATFGDLEATDSTITVTGPDVALTTTSPSSYTTTLDNSKFTVTDATVKLATLRTENGSIIDVDNSTFNVDPKYTASVGESTFTLTDSESTFGSLSLNDTEFTMDAGSTATLSSSFSGYSGTKAIITGAGTTLTAKYSSTLNYASTLDILAGAKAQFSTLKGMNGSTYTIDGADSELTVTSTSYYTTTLDESHLILSNGATATFGSGKNGTVNVEDNSTFTVKSGATATIAKLDVSPTSTVTVTDTNSTMTVTGYASLGSTSKLIVEGGAKADLYSLSLNYGCQALITGTGTTLSALGSSTYMYTADYTVKDGATADIKNLSAQASTISVSSENSYIKGTSSASLNDSDFSVLDGAEASFTGLTASKGSSLLVDGTGSNFTTTGAAPATFNASPLTVTDHAVATFGKDGKTYDETTIKDNLGGGGNFYNSDILVSDGATVTFGNAFTHNHNTTAFTHYMGDLDLSSSDLTVTGDGSTFKAGELTMNNGALSVSNQANVDFGQGVLPATNQTNKDPDKCATFTNSPVTVTGAPNVASADNTKLSVCGDASFTNSDVSVTGGSTAVFGKYFDHVHTTGDTAIVDHYDGVLDFVNSDLTVTDSGTTFYAGSASMDHGTLTMSEGVKVNMGKGGLHFSNGGAIKVIGGEIGHEDSNNPANDTRADTVAALNLHGNLVLDNSTIDVDDAADLTIYFYDNGNTISGAPGSINTINVSGEGSTLHVSLQNGTSQTPKLFDDVILNVKDNAIFEVDGLDFKFTGGASADEVVNLSIGNGAHAVFDKLAIETADIDVTNAGDKASAFVAEQLTFVDSTFTVSQSYAQVNSLLSDENQAVQPAPPAPAPAPISRSMPMMRAAPTPPIALTLGSDSYLGSLTTSSDLRIAAGGVFVLGEVGTAPEDTAKELLLGLKATSPESAGAAGAAQGNYTTLTPGSTSSYSITLDPKHSAFTMTGGERLTINKGSSLIIDADAASKIEGGANKYLLDNVPLYIGHDDILLIDNIDKGYNVLEGQPQGVITIADGGLDTAYILAADSKIRVIVKNGDVEEKTFAVIYDKNHASDATHTISGNDYKGDIYFTLGDKGNLGDKNENYFSTCKHVNGGGAGYTDDNRITTKTYDTIIMQNVDYITANGEIGETIPAGKSYVKDVGGKYTVYEFKMGITGYKPNFGVEDELYNSLVEVYKAKDSSLQAADDATRFLTKTTVYATEKHDKDAAIKLGSVTEIAVVGGVANMTHDAMTATTDALGRYLDYGINATGAYDEKGAFSLWGIPPLGHSAV